MNLRRFGWALYPLALTLVLGACSTPADLTAPTLEPQFGTEYNDVGVDVTVTTNGYVYELEQGGYGGEYYDESWEEDIWYVGNTIDLSRYDNNGNFVWSTEVADDYCSELSDACGSSVPVTVFSDARGYVYVLFSRDENGYGERYYHVSKYDSTGRLIRRIQFGDGFISSSLGLDATVDASGNLYVIHDESFVAKYSPSGSLLWQRTTTVGASRSISLSSNGYVYVAGSTGVAKYTNSGNLSWTKAGAANDIAAVGTNIVYARNFTTVRKLDANGKQLWSKAQTGLSGMVVGDMTTDSSANVYLTGKYSTSSNSRDVFTRKLSASSGSTVFTKTFGTSAYDDARGVATVSGNEIYITGATQGSLAQPFRGGENDGYIRKLSSSGSPIWTR